MIDIADLRVAKPHEVEPGTLLIAGAHFESPPALVFDHGDERYWFEFGGSTAFEGFQMAVNLHPYIIAGAPSVLVDVDQTISPMETQIPKGSVVLIGDDAYFAIRIKYGTVYVALDGKAIDDPSSYGKLVAFPHWQVVIPAFGDSEWKIVHEAGA